MRGQFKKFTPTSIRHMNQFHIGWVAGIFEGEGSISAAESGGTATLKVSMTDKDTVLRLKEVTGIGNITDYKLKSGKIIYNWTVCRRYDVINLLVSLVPVLSSRRRQRISEILDRIDVPTYPTGVWTIKPIEMKFKTILDS